MSDPVRMLLPLPLLALAGYALAIRFTFSIARGRALR